MNKQNTEQNKGLSMTNSTVEEKKLEIFIYEMMEFRFGDGTGANYSINTSVKEVADYVKQHFTPNSKLQESNEKYLDGFVSEFWNRIDEFGMSGLDYQRFMDNLHKLKVQYNKLNGGNRG